jgi:DNA-binding FadR family transcriptional regulator
MEHTAQTFSQEIAARLSRRIVEGQYPVGTRLPTERELAVEFGVTRHVVREALKRLEAVGLVRIRQGSGIHVENLQLTGGIELFDTLLTRDDGSINVPVLLDVLDFRAQMERQILRLAAERRTDEELAEMQRLFQQRQAVQDDPAALEKIYEQLFRLFARATRNRIYELLFNTMWRVFFKFSMMIDVPLMGMEQTERLLSRILEAFQERDGEMAELLVARHLAAIRRTFTGDVL